MIVKIEQRGVKAYGKQTEAEALKAECWMMIGHHEGGAPDL